MSLVITLQTGAHNSPATGPSGKQTSAEDVFLCAEYDTIYYPKEGHQTTAPNTVKCCCRWVQCRGHTSYNVSDKRIKVRFIILLGCVRLQTKTFGGCNEAQSNVATLRVNEVISFDDLDFFEKT